MRHIAFHETAAANAASIEQLIVAAGGHLWSPDAIAAYMKAEAAKLRANWLYHLSKILPFQTENRGDNFEATLGLALIIGCAVMILGYACMGALIYSDYGATVVSIFAYIGTAGACIIIPLCTLAYFRINFVVLGPGHWKTRAFDPDCVWHQKLATPEVLSRARIFQEMIPGVRFEISLLYQDEWLFDPVLWAIAECSDGTIRVPFIVWGPDGNIVLPA